MRATEIAKLLATQAEAVAQHLLPNGRRHGHDWCCGSIHGEPGNSMKVTLSGTKAGVWCDFGGSADDKGDLIGLWMRVRGLPIHEACTAAMDWLNIPASQREAYTPVHYKAPAVITTRAPSETWLRLQTSLRQGTISELAALASLRKLPAFAGLELATRSQHLYFADVFDDGFDYPSWIITDASRRNAQARRMDGKPFSVGKAKTIKGCEAKWPVGIANIATPEVALVEGGPDFLAAHHLIWFMGKTKDITPVAMLGASNQIHDDALPLFAGKHVYIFPHSDDNEAGQAAAKRWAEQLHSVGAATYPFNLDGQKDLNDFVVAEQAKLDAEDGQ